MQGSPLRPHPTVVVGVDGSLGSLVALRWAAQEAVGLDAELLAVHAYHPAPDARSCEWPVCTPDHPAEQAQARIAGVVRQALAGEPARPAIRILVRAGEAGPILAEAAHHARMLVVGSRGHGRLVGALLGSVGAYCQRHARCPVVVIPTPPEAQAERMYPLPHVFLGA